MVARRSVRSLAMGGLLFAAWPALAQAPSGGPTGFCALVYSQFCAQPTPAAAPIMPPPPEAVPARPGAAHAAPGKAKPHRKAAQPGG